MILSIVTYHIKRRMQGFFVERPAPFCYHEERQHASIGVCLCVRSTSSTPHAPRLLHRPLRLTTSTGSGIHHPVQAKHVSMPPASTLTHSSQQATPTIPAPENKGGPSTPALVKMSWNSHNSKETVQQVRLICFQDIVTVKQDPYYSYTINYCKNSIRETSNLCIFSCITL